MRFGIAVWNYKTPDVGLPALIQSFADDGFDAASLLMQAMVQTDDGELREIRRVAAERALALTLHGNFERTPAECERVLRLLGNTVAAITFDAAVLWEDEKRRFHTAQMLPLLQEVQRVTEGSSVAFAVEDFPLNDSVLNAHREELTPLLQSPRFGILIDVGHMNLRRHQEAGFTHLSVAEYLQQVPLPIVEVHLHDNLGDRDSHGHFGFGNVDFAQVAAGLR
ncbi:MAG: TIM barrel protein, partial [Armatimonadota bacterium]|nr:TIM barrel protein [Armatimonadota bacterium]